MVIAKFDCTANDEPNHAKLAVHGYPTLYFVTATGDGAHVLLRASSRRGQDLICWPVAGAFRWPGSICTLGFICKTHPLPTPLSPRNLPLRDRLQGEPAGTHPAHDPLLSLQCQPLF